MSTEFLSRSSCQKVAAYERHQSEARMVTVRHGMRGAKFDFLRYTFTQNRTKMDPDGHRRVRIPDFRTGCGVGMMRQRNARCPAPANSARTQFFPDHVSSPARAGDGAFCVLAW
jgi:hypothetical protein